MDAFPLVEWLIPTDATRSGVTGHGSKNETAPTGAGAVGPGLLTLGGCTPQYQLPLAERQVPPELRIVSLGWR